MSAPYDYDVCVVGGGPAGVACAITVAKHGHSVVLLDKKSREKIGDKTCGDAIDKAALQRVYDKVGIDFPQGSEVSDDITKMSIAANQIDLKLTLDAPGYVLDRHVYGQRLIKQAEENGVLVIPRAPVRGIITEEINGETFLSGVKYYHEGQKKELTAKFIIDASGAYASVRKELPEEFIEDGMKKELDDHEVWPTYREIIKLNEEVVNHRWLEEIVLMYDNKYPAPGYFWIFTKGEGVLNTGIGWEKTQDLGKLKQKFMDELSLHYSEDEYTVIKRGGGQIPFRPPFDNVVFNGGALAGDAACMVHPVTAEGHGPALDTASDLGLILVEALEENDRSKEKLWKYNVKIASHYGQKHMEAHILKEFLREFGAEGLKYIIERDIFKEEELNLIFSGGNLELPFWEQIKRVAKLLLKPKMMLGLRKVLNLSDKCKKIYSQYPASPKDIDEWREKRNSVLNVDF